MSAAVVQKNTVYFECGENHFSEKKTDKLSNEEESGNGGSFNHLISSMEIDTANSMCQNLDHYNHKDNDQYRLHGTLTRTISQPQQDANVTSLVCTLIENLGNMNLHRKLERTQSEPLPQQVNTSRYKTELCRPFEEAGECKYGEKCQFAHGYHELRNLQRHPKYKTEYCRTFHSVGFCPYGPRCHFVHNADEARAMQQQQQQQQQQTKQQNHSSLNNCISTYILPQKQNHNHNTIPKHSLPLSPPLSMSTGSDRESPTGSLSLSPTSSMTSFPFGDQVSPANSAFQTAFSYVNTPPESPNAPMSPVNTPPPTILGAIQNQNQMYIKPITQQSKQIVHKSTSSPPIAIIRNASNNPTKVTTTTTPTSSNGCEDARLPVFNRLSSAVENLSNLAL